MDNNQAATASRIAELEAQNKIFSELLYGKTGVASGLQLIEREYAKAKKADPQDAPMPLTGEDAALWHRASASAFQYALEMISLDLPQQKLISLVTESNRANFWYGIGSRVISIEGESGYNSTDDEAHTGPMAEGMIGDVLREQENCYGVWFANGVSGFLSKTELDDTTKYQILPGIAANLDIREACTRDSDLHLLNAKSGHPFLIRLLMDGDARGTGPVTELLYEGNPALEFYDARHNFIDAGRCVSDGSYAFYATSFGRSLICMTCDTIERQLPQWEDGHHFVYEHLNIDQESIATALEWAKERILARSNTLKP